MRSPQEVAQPLEGDYRPEHLFTLKQSLNSDRYYKKLIAELDKQIVRLMKILPSAENRPPCPLVLNTRRTNST